MNKRPNILILTTDQQRFDTIHAAGFKYMKTPNLDRLVSEGCLFTNAYSPVPICIPARHNIITGLTPRHHSFDDNHEPGADAIDFYYKYNTPYMLPTFPFILSNCGYDTRAIGKMHFRPNRRHNGFNKMELMEELPTFREEDEYAMYLKDVGLGNIQNIHGVRNLLYMVPQRSLIPEEHHGTKWVADRTIDFLRSNRGRQPFLLWSSWIQPHPPFDVPDRHADLYNNVKIPEPYVSETPLSPLAKENAALGDLPNHQYIRRMRELYYAAISYVDENIGRVLDALEEIGELDNTLIIFTSDHGEMLGDYGAYQKWLPYDSCSRIPFIVRYPKQIQAGTVREDFVDLNDILPTVLDVAGEEYSYEFDLPGSSIFKEAKDRSLQFVEYSRGKKRWISVRDVRYKYNYYYGGGIEELFDLDEDPHETRNLLANSGEDIEAILEGIANVRNRLRSKLIQYENKYGLEGYVKDEELIKLDAYEPRFKRESRMPRFVSAIVDEEEKNNLNDYCDEIIQAIKDEPVVKLEELDLESWEKNCRITDEDVSRLIKGCNR